MVDKLDIVVVDMVVKLFQFTVRRAADTVNLVFHEQIVPRCTIR